MFPATFPLTLDEKNAAPLEDTAEEMQIFQYW